MRWLIMSHLIWVYIVCLLVFEFSVWYHLNILFPFLNFKCINFVVCFFDFWHFKNQTVKNTFESNNHKTIENWEWWKFLLLGKRGLSKQCRPRSDCFWSGSTLFASLSKIVWSIIIYQSIIHHLNCMFSGHLIQSHIKLTLSETISHIPINNTSFELRVFWPSDTESRIKLTLSETVSYITINNTSFELHVFWPSDTEPYQTNIIWNHITYTYQ